MNNELKLDIVQKKDSRKIIFRYIMLRTLKFWLFSQYGLLKHKRGTVHGPLCLHKCKQSIGLFAKRQRYKPQLCYELGV